VEQKLWQDKLKIDITYFDADLTDKIASGLLDIDGDGVLDPTVVNLDGKSQRRGVEVALTARLIDGLILTGSYTYTDTKNSDGNQEIRRPKHAASLNVNYAFSDGRGNVSAGLNYNGTMTDKPYYTPTVWLDDYLLVNVAASYKLDDRITLFGRVENMLDTDYEEVYGYTSAPAAAYAGLKVEFTEDAPLEPMK
jgi:vitamin B12 transporter